MNRKRILMCGGVLGVLVLSLLAFSCGRPPSGACCAMCGIPQKPNMAATVVLRDGRREEYCCPHCAIMGMSLANYSVNDIQEVLLADFDDASRLPAEEAVIVFETETVPCCAPGIIAFRDSAAAACFQERFHGRILPWREIVACMLKNRCRACGMVLYPPSAIPIVQEQEKLQACCPICALVLATDTPSTISLCDVVGGQEIEIKTSVTGMTVHPKGTRFWVGMNGKGNARKPAGCHFNLVFALPETLVAWRAVHPDRDGNDLAPGEALEFARKMKPMMEKKRQERLHGQ